MAGAINDFREFRVYGLAFEAAMEMVQLSKKWPARE